MKTDTSRRAKNIQTLWQDYHKICDLCGKNSSQAQSMFEDVWWTEERFIRQLISEIWSRRRNSPSFISPEIMRDIKEWGDE